MKTKTATTQFFEPQNSVTKTLQNQSQWGSVSEQDSLFLALFPHRFDYLWAEHTDPGVRPEWQTESRHPLSDRLLQQASYLYGVRFSKLTRYCVLDIDKHSAFHPTRDPLAIKRMVAALEAIGLVSYVVVTSSYSGGIHLYFPFKQAQASWSIALIVTTLLENTGFKLKPGQLEVFPNPRPFTEGPLSLYNGHRLPLQAGSYLLNEQWQFVYTDQAAFVEQWRWAEGRNDLNQKTIERVLKQARRQRYKHVAGGAQKFLNDLHTEVEQGWTGPSQTNRLLGRIAMRTYIFGHVLRSGAPLTGQALADAIREVAVALPGYTEWCRHQHEIDKLASNWARDIEADPNYYPYDPSKRRKAAPQSESQPQNNIVSFQQSLALGAAQRIKAAIATLQATDKFPTGATARADAIITLARCSNQTLHKYKALWHPDHSESRVGTLAEPEAATSDRLTVAPQETLEPLLEGSLHDFAPNKFVANPAAPSEQAEKLREVGGAGGISTGQAAQPVPAATEPNNAALNPENTATEQVDSPTPAAAKANSNPEIAITKPNSLPTKQAAATPSRENKPVSPSPLTGAAAVNAQWVVEKRQRRAAAKAAQREVWLASGDPILVKEAQAWFAAQVGPCPVTLPTERGDPRG